MQTHNVKTINQKETDFEYKTICEIKSHLDIICYLSLYIIKRGFQICSMTILSEREPAVKLHLRIVSRETKDTKGKKDHSGIHNRGISSTVVFGYAKLLLTNSCVTLSESKMETVNFFNRSFI